MFYSVKDGTEVQEHKNKNSSLGICLTMHERSSPMPKLALWPDSLDGGVTATMETNHVFATLQLSTKM